MSELTALELQQETVEELPARELMCGCGCGGNTYQIGLVNIDDSALIVNVL
jgi:hypothetical protein